MTGHDAGYDGFGPQSFLSEDGACAGFMDTYSSTNNLLNLSQPIDVHPQRLLGHGSYSQSTINLQNPSTLHSGAPQRLNAAEREQKVPSPRMLQPSYSQSGGLTQ